MAPILTAEVRVTHLVQALGKGQVPVVAVLRAKVKPEV